MSFDELKNIIEMLLNNLSSSISESEYENRIDGVIKYLSKIFPNRIQMFNNKNISGDGTITIYNRHNITVDFCPKWHYVEIFGVTTDEFNEIKSKSGY